MCAPLLSSTLTSTHADMLYIDPDTWRWPVGDLTGLGIFVMFGMLAERVDLLSVGLAVLSSKRAALSECRVVLSADAILPPAVWCQNRTGHQKIQPLLCFLVSHSIIHTHTYKYTPCEGSPERSNCRERTSGDTCPLSDDWLFQCLQTRKKEKNMHITYYTACSVTKTIEIQVQ